MVKFASPSCVRFISFGFLLATTCVWVWMVCSLPSVTTGSRDRANVPLIIIIITIIASEREVSRRATRSESAIACREHTHVGPMTDVKGQSTWLAS